MARHRVLCLRGLLGAVRRGLLGGASPAHPRRPRATATAMAAGARGEPLPATDTGVTADTITVQVMADTGSALAPGLFQGNIDAIEGLREVHQRQRRHRLSEAQGRDVGLQARPRPRRRTARSTRARPRWPWWATTPCSTRTSSEMTTLRRRQGCGHGRPEHRRPGQRHQRAVRDEHATRSRAWPSTARREPGCPPAPAHSPRTGATCEVPAHPRPGPAVLFMVPGDLPDDGAVGHHNIARPGARPASTWVGASRCPVATSRPAYTPKVQAAKNGA